MKRSKFNVREERKKQIKYGQKEVKERIILHSMQSLVVRVSNF